MAGRVNPKPKERVWLGAWVDPTVRKDAELVAHVRNVSKKDGGVGGLLWHMTIQDIQTEASRIRQKAREE